MNSPENDDVFNFGYRDNSLDDFSTADFHLNTTYSQINKPNDSKRKSLINFSMFGNNNTTNGRNDNIANSTSNFGEKSKIIPSGFLSKIQREDIQNQQHFNNRNSPPKKKSPFDLPPLETLLDSDDNSNISNEDHNFILQKRKSDPNQYNQDELSDQTAVTISDSSSSKAIPNSSSNTFNKNSKTKSPPKTKILAENYQISVENPTRAELRLNLESTFDNAIENFGYYFFNELKNLLKPSKIPISSPEIDNFAFSLANEINESFSLPPAQDRTEAIISRMNSNINIILKEEIDQMSQLLKQNSVRLKAQQEKDLNSLKKLDVEVKSLNQSYQSIKTEIMKSLENERVGLARTNDIYKSQLKMLLDSKRNLSLNRMELETVVNRQKNNAFQLQRKENNLYYAREELHEELLGAYDTKYRKLKVKINCELDGIMEFVENPEFEVISTKARELNTLLKFNDENEPNTQPQDKPQPYMIPYSKPQLQYRDQNEEENHDQLIKASINSMAKLKLEELKKQREAAAKKISKRSKK